MTSAGIQGAGQEDWRDLLISSGVSIALVTFTRPGANSKEMSVVKGDYLEVPSYHIFVGPLSVRPRRGKILSA